MAELSGLGGCQVDCQQSVGVGGKVFATERDALVARLPFGGGDGFCQIECAYIIFNARVGGGGEVLGEVLDIEVAEVLIAGTAVEIG